MVSALWRKTTREGREGVTMGRGGKRFKLVVRKESVEKVSFEQRFEGIESVSFAEI